MDQHTRAALTQRIADKIAEPDDNGCWNWIAFVQNNGYGKVYFRGSVWLAHRTTYTLLVGEIPEDLVIDHLCRNRRCVNPKHLRAVTQRENTLAPGSESASAVNASKTRCAHGHRLSGPVGQRRCRTCERTRDRARWPQRSSKRAASNRRRWELPPAERQRLHDEVVDAFGDSDRITLEDVVARLMGATEWRTKLAAMSPRGRSIWLNRVVGPSRKHRFDGRVASGYRRDEFTTLTGRGNGRQAVAQR